MYRVSQGDEVDAESAPFYVNSSLAPVLLFRRRLKSVADVLKGSTQHGFTQTRRDALLGYWGAVCRRGCILATGGFPQTHMAFTSGSLMPWRFVMISLCNVGSRKVAGLLQCANWLREDLGSRPCHPFLLLRTDTDVQDFGRASSNRC